MHPHRTRRSANWPHSFADPALLKSFIIAAVLLAALVGGIVLITRGLL